MSTSGKIEKIIERRKERLPLIETKEKGLKDLEAKIQSLTDLIGTISYQKNEKQGPYYNMLLRDPEMAVRIDNITDMTAGTSHRFAKLDKLISEYSLQLSTIKARFGRDAIQVAFVGRERQGKSTFLQSITGLDNKIIPAFDGTSCTGTISTIHNIDDDKDFRVEIEFWDERSFLDDIKSKIEEFWSREKAESIWSMDDFAKLDCDEMARNVRNSAFVTSIKKRIEFLEDYRGLLGKGMLKTKDTQEIVQYVAQYEELNELPEGVDDKHIEKVEGRDTWKRLYFKYFAVKTVTIYKHFPTVDCGKMILVDSVGLGNSADGDAPQKQMLDIMRYKCDAAVDVFRPDSMGNTFTKEQKEILELIHNELPDRELKQWFAYILNRVKCDRGNNVHLIKPIKEAIEQDRRGFDDYIWLGDCDGSNPEEVRVKLLQPLLDNVISNLDSIDNTLLRKLNETGEKLYHELLMVYQAASSVISASFKNDANMTRIFDGLYQNLTLFSGLRELDECKYALSKDSVCKEVAEELETTTKSIYRLVPDITTITEEVNRGVDAAPQIYVKYINIFRNKIFDAFENVNSEVIVPLQEQVKKDVISALYEQGLLKNIPLSVNALEPTTEWLSTFIEEKVSEEEYPKLYEALKYILDYSVSIDGLIEYNVAKSLERIDPMSAQFMPMRPDGDATSVDEKADDIWQWIMNTVTGLQNSLRKWQNDFSLIPSHSFYARIHKFREKIVWDEQGQKDLKNFYCDNAATIWQETFHNNAIMSQAFGEWNNVIDGLRNNCRKELYEISIA